MRTLAVFLTIALAASVCNGQWYWQNLPLGEDLVAEKFTDANTGTAVGDCGTILCTTNGGATFVQPTRIGEVPSAYFLHQNYPNPFNPSTTIRYALPRSSFVTLTVYNTLGQQVAQLVNEQQQAGYHQAVFRGDGLSSGVYFYRISVSPLARRDLVPTDGRDGQAGGFVASRRLLLLK